MTRMGFLFCTTGLIAVAASATAQAQAPATAPSDAPAGLEEIVVTAQKREENLQSTAITVQAVDGSALAREGVRDLVNLNRVVPSLQLWQGSNATRVSLRGVVAGEVSVAAESPIAVHVDGAYLSRMTGLAGLLFDVQRVEVLKGPQGTLYGRNATGGALNIVTNHPIFDREAKAQIEVGTYRTLRAEGVFNVPLSDKLAVRAAVRQYTHDGYSRNGLDDADQLSGRFSSLWKISDRAQLYAAADFQRITSKGPADNMVANTTGTRIPPSRDNRVLYGSADRATSDARTWGFVGQFDYRWNPVTLTVVAANRGLKAEAQVYSGLTLGYLPATSHSSSVEARIASNDPGLIEYVAGVYYFDESTKGGLFNYSSLTSQTYASYFWNPVNDTRSTAAFGQITVNPTDRLHLIGGLRYTRDSKVAEVRTLLLGRATTVPGDATWDALNYKVGVNYDVSERSLLYANVSTAFKGGGFAFGAKPQYDPEHITAYEIGSKNRFFDNRLQVNLSAFRYDYRDFEVTYRVVTFDPATGQNVVSLNATNAGAARFTGVDLETQFLATRRDRFDFNVSYLKARFKENDLRRLGQPDLSGQPIPNAPKWSFNAAYTHTWEVLSGTLDTRIGTLFSSRRLMNLTRTDLPDARFQGAFFRTNISARYKMDGAPWSLTVYANDLENNDAWTTVAVTGTNTFAQFIPPRTFGLIADVAF